MTDAAIGETPMELVPALPPAPQVAAELEAEPPPEAVAEVPDLSSPNLANANAELDVAPPSGEAPAGDTGETEAVEAFDPRISIPETLGPVRCAILEGLIDGDGPMSVAQLHALMPVGTPRGTAEAGILREYRSGRIIRTGPGHYVLASVQPPGAKPAPPPEQSERGDDEWLTAMDAWFADRASWDVEALAWISTACN
jgi:hypothetical protein